MAYFDRLPNIKKIAGRGAGIFLLAAFCVLAISVSSPRSFSANAANWLDNVFGDFKPRQRHYGRRKVRAPKRIVVKPAKSFFGFEKKNTYRKTRAKKAYGIGRIDGLDARKKRKTYRIPRAASKGTYRTMCVRTCDGYYFPVSFATTKGRLKKDANACKSSCGSPAKLYYYPNPGGEIKDMVSLRGAKKYQKLKNAFLFKKEYVASCRCAPEPWSDASKQRHAKYARLEVKRLKRVAKRKARASKRRSAKRKSRSRKRTRRYSRRSGKRAYRISGSRKRVRARTSRRSKKARRPRTTSNWTY